MATILISLATTRRKSDEELKGLVYMFTIFGVLLTADGLLSDAAIHERSLGIDVNLWWGLVLLAFGLAMIGLAIWTRRNVLREPRRNGG